MLEVREFTDEGRAPFSDWLTRLDRTAKARVLTRIDRVRRGNFGDTKSVGDGVFELRLDFGPGYRVYFGREGTAVVILLCGGDKDSQPKDIRRAKELWAQYGQRLENKHGNQTVQRNIERCS